MMTGKSSYTLSKPNMFTGVLTVGIWAFSLAQHMNVDTRLTASLQDQHPVTVMLSCRVMPRPKTVMPRPNTIKPGPNTVMPRPNTP